jgi:hypothetical protein
MFTGLPQGRKDQLQAAAFIEETPDGLGAVTLFGKGTLNQVGGTNAAVMQRWAA